MSMTSETTQANNFLSNLFGLNKDSVQRKTELIRLAYFNLNVFQLMHGLQTISLSDKAKEKITQYGWPGQATELESILERAVQKCKNGVIEPIDLEINQTQSELEFPLGLKLENVERQYILQTLYFVEQNRTKAAEVLGISIRTLRNKLNQYRIEGHI